MEWEASGRERGRREGRAQDDGGRKEIPRKRSGSFRQFWRWRGERDGGVYEGGAGSQGRKEDEGTEASEHGMTRNKGREGKKTF